MPEQSKMVDIDTSGNPVDVDIDNQEEEQKQEDVAVEQQDTSVREVESSDDDELEEHTDKVQKRIDKLTAKMREAERREQAALEYAEGLKKQYSDLDLKYKKLDDGYLNEFKNRLEISKTALQDKYTKAVQSGDIKAQVEAQEELTRLTIDAERLRATQAKQSRESEAGTEVKTESTPKLEQPRKPDPKAEAWAHKNPWFGSDEAMTYTVFSIHKKLVSEEGFDPTSDEYYDELDRRVRESFPQKFSGGNNAGTTQNSRANRPVQTVAPATRSSGVNNSARRTVRLSPSQVAIAKKLGVPLEEYAKYVKE